MSMFQKATRKRAFIKMAITGPSGSGKTLSALFLAQGLAGDGGKIAVIDTENESASLYSDRANFDTCPIEAPFTTAKYMAAINGAVGAGYTVLVIDSLTHEWAGEGGILAQKETLDARGGNSFTNWGVMTKQHEAFKAALLQAPIHIIATMRSKQEYVVDSGDGRKAAPRKVGMAPIQRDGMEYEFTTVLDIGMSHEAVASKDRSGLFDGVIGTLTAAHGRKIREWLDSGAEPLPEPEPAAAPPVPAATGSPNRLIPDPHRHSELPRPNREMPPATPATPNPREAILVNMSAFVAEAVQLGVSDRVHNSEGKPSRIKTITFLEAIMGNPNRPNPLSEEDWSKGIEGMEAFVRTGATVFGAGVIPLDSLPATDSPLMQSTLSAVPGVSVAEAAAIADGNDPSATAQPTLTADDDDDPFKD